MKNKWNYSGLGRVLYGHQSTYKRPCAWLDEVGGTLEDWGCGCAGAKEHVKRCRYVGLDGSQNDYADRCDVDLREYTSEADCILLRHVIDHNEDWEKILRNAVASFKKRMVLIIFHDLGPVTRVLFRQGSQKFPGVVDMQFKREDLMKHIAPYLIREERVLKDNESPNNNTLFYLEKI